MTTVVSAGRDWLQSLVTGWDQFWFTPAKPHTLCVIRILAGAMMFYTHLVWAYGSSEFMAEDAWIPASVARATAEPYAWSHLYYVESPTILMLLHVAALVVFALLTLGVFTRVMAVAAWLLTVAYCHRMQGALFGLDQINAMLGMYLMLGPCGAVYSIDSWWKNRSSTTPVEVKPSVAANIAIRLIQIHLCVIYLFSGIGKTKGNMWWDGSAAWFSVANYEYQSLDMTWIASMPWLIALLSHVTLFWELSYWALIWPRRTRPIMLAIAVGVHGGIMLFLGMITFGGVMLIANLAFIPPEIFGWLESKLRSGNATDTSTNVKVRSRK